MGVGFIRGSGKLRSGFLINFVAYWLIGLPMGYYLTMHLNFGNIGVLIGFAMAMASTSAFYEIFIIFLDWPKLFTEIQERHDQDKASRQKLK